MSVEALVEWVRQHADGASVHLRGMGDDPVEGVSLMLVAIDPAAAFGAGTLRIDLTYRLTVRLANAGAGNDLLCNLAFAAIEVPQLSAEGDTPRRPIRLLAPEKARSLNGPASEPCLHLVLTVERQREMTPALPVRERILRSHQDVPRLSAGQGR